MKVAEALDSPVPPAVKQFMLRLQQLMLDQGHELEFKSFQRLAYADDQHNNEVAGTAVRFKCDYPFILFFQDKRDDCIAFVKAGAVSSNIFDNHGTLDHQFSYDDVELLADYLTQHIEDDSPLGQ